jgi:hypothetical protein
MNGKQIAFLTLAAECIALGYCQTPVLSDIWTVAALALKFSGRRLLANCAGAETIVRSRNVGYGISLSRSKLRTTLTMPSGLLASFLLLCCKDMMSGTGPA